MAVPLTAVVLTLAACTVAKSNAGGVSPVAKSSQDSAQPTDAPTTQAAVPAAVIKTVPAAASGVNPGVPVTVSVSDGTLTSVKLVNAEGKSVSGALAADATSWASTEDLGYSKTYTLSAMAVNADGKAVAKKSTFTTLTPANMTMPYLQRPGGYSLDNGATYGIGIVPVVHFDEAITNKKAAEQALTVTTTPHVDGVWNWVDDQNVHWRPKNYLASGTKVTVTAKVYGVQVGQGLYGQADQSVSFKIGAKHISIADDKTHTVKVYFNGRLMRTMPTSMGQHMTVQGSNGPVSLWTMDGTYTVLEHDDPAIMSSASFGLPTSSPYGYAPENVYKAVKISPDGIYLHSAPWSVWAQGNTDTSHGCLNLSPDNATWYYQTSQVGDIVQVLNNGGPTLQEWQNGDWSVPWSTWVKGSAL